MLPKSPPRPLPLAKRAAPAAHFLRDDGSAAAGFLLERIVDVAAPAGIGAGAVGAHAGLREAGDLLRQRDGGGARFAGFHQAVGEAPLQRLLRIDGAAGEDHVHGAALADDAGQAKRAAIDQRHAPAPAIDAEDGGLGCHAHVGHQRQLEPAGDRVAFDGGDQRLGERDEGIRRIAIGQQARRPHRRLLGMLLGAEEPDAVGDPSSGPRRSRTRPRPR